MALDPIQVGDFTEARVLSELIRLGFEVTRPCNSGTRWDLGIVLGAQLVRLQVKHAQLINNVVIFATCKSRNCVDRTYHGSCELIVAYCPATDTCYATQPETAPRKTLSLRLSPSANGQKTGINWAEDFVLDQVLSKFLARHYPNHLVAAM